MNPPLGGITFLEVNSRDCVLGVRLATQFAGKVALDLGARVIRVAPQGGYPTGSEDDRAVSGFLDDGKHSIAVPEGANERSACIAELARDCDAVLVDDRVPLADAVRGPGTASIGPPIVARLSLLGRRVERPGSEFTVMASSGLLDTVGDPAREPLKLGGHQLAYSAGLAAYAGVAAALLARKVRRGTAPEVVRVSLLETALWINWKNLASASYFETSPTRPGRGATWQVVRCADGWVALVYVEKDWPALKTLVDDSRLDDRRFATEQGRARHAREIGDVVESVFLRFSRREIEAKAKAKRLPLGAVWSPVELAQDLHYKAREVFTRTGTDGRGLAPRLPVRVHRPATVTDFRRSPMRAAAVGGERVLAGCRVLDLGILTAGAATSAMLADLGADVIKVESRRYGDPFRVWPEGVTRGGTPSNADCPPYYRATNRNKRSICLDLKTPGGRDALLRLAAHSDVLVENFRRGVLDDLGIGYDALRLVNKHLVLASLSSQGENGPDTDRVSFGSTLEATGGLAWLTGYPDGEPVISGQILNYADQVVSIFGAGMILTALLERDATGSGMHLQLSQRELITYLVGEVFSREETSSDRRGNGEAPHVVQQCFRSRDGQWIALTVDAGNVEGVRKLVGARANDATDGETLSAALGSWMARHASTACIASLAAAGVAVARVLDGKEALRARHPAGHALAELAGGALVKGFPFQLDAMPLRVDADARALGEDTLAVLRDVAGYSSDEIEALLAADAVGVAGAGNASRSIRITS